MKKNNFKIPDELILTEKRVDDFLKIDPNAFDNYNHRNIRVSFIIKTIWSDFKLARSRTGIDSTVESLGLRDVEMKTTNIPLNKILKQNKIGHYIFNKSFMFDKQDRPNRRRSQPLSSQNCK